MAKNPSEKPATNKSELSSAAKEFAKLIARVLAQKWHRQNKPKPPQC
ncbi:hypothetical protein [Rubinisphaera italica]|uniref:Uncharacterized protein n=1 Tax=Rubinisphaera italica TaxID=2527969 RepID=A0A5C5XP83_9PLAN|nr:hypothetical protein [Rubinisphaera italica]TWT64379.1 hypothetical protein Pan54_51410 [Rubinisphaera italica]